MSALSTQKECCQELKISSLWQHLKPPDHTPLMLESLGHCLKERKPFIENNIAVCHKCCLDNNLRFSSFAPLGNIKKILSLIFVFCEMMTPPEVHRLSAKAGSSSPRCQNFKVCNIRVSGTGFWQTCSAHDGIHKLQNWNKTHLSKYMSIQGREKGKEEGNGQCSGLKCPHACVFTEIHLGLNYF